MGKSSTKKKVITSQIKEFELIYSGLEESSIDVAKIRKVKSGFLCTITIHDDDFSSKTVYKDVLYPREISKMA